MVAVDATLKGRAPDGTLIELPVDADGIRTKDQPARDLLEAIRAAVQGVLDVDTGLAPQLAAGLDVRVTSQPAPPVEYPLPAAQVAALAPPATQQVSGTVTVANPTAAPETGLAKEATLAAVRDRTSFPLPADQVTALSPRATQPVSGTVTVSNPTPAPETGLAKDTTLRDGSVRVGGTIAVSGAVDVTDRAGRALGTVSTGLQQPLTDAQLRATAVPVATGLTPLTDTQLRATPVPVSGALALSGAVDVSDRAARLLGRVEVVADRTLSYYASAAGGRVAFNSFAERTGLANGTEVVIGVLLNPTGSGRDLYLDKRALTCSQPGRWVRTRGANLTLPVGGRQPVENRGGGTGTAVGEIILGSTVGLVVTGGTTSRPNYLPANADEGDEPNGSIVLRPGDNLVWRFTPAAAGAGASVFVAWHELPATP